MIAATMMMTTMKEMTSRLVHLALDADSVEAGLLLFLLLWGSLPLCGCVPIGNTD
jgi:hypothetical protein